MPLPYRVKWIALDWDDTVNDSYLSIRRQCAELGALLPPEGTYLTTENTQGLLDTVLEKGEFMSERLVRDGDYELTREIQQLQLHGIGVGICTHRGFHKDAMVLSEPAFNQLDWRPDFIIILDPAKTPDKTEVLDETFGVGEWALVDDRPRWDTAGELPDNVLLMDQGWNQQHVPASDKHRVNGLHGLAVRLSEIKVGRKCPATIESAYGYWTQADEINHAIAYGALEPTAHRELEDMAKALKLKRTTPQKWASTMDTTRATVELIERRPSDMRNGFTYQRKLVRALCGLPILPIYPSDATEWKDLGDKRVAIRYPTLTEEGGHYFIDEKFLQPSTYYTRWTEAFTSRKRIQPLNHEIVIGFAPPVRYVSKDRIEINDHITFGANQRGIVLESLRRGEDIVTGLPVQPIIKQFLDQTSIVGDEDCITFLEFYKYATESWADRGPTVGWRTVVGEWLSYVIPNGRTMRMVMLLQKHIPSVRVEIKNLKHWVQTSPTTYLVNTEEGLADAVKDFATNLGIDKVEYKTVGSLPTVLSFIAVGDVIHYTATPLVEIMLAVQNSQA